MREREKKRKLRKFPIESFFVAKTLMFKMGHKLSVFSGMRMIKER